MRFRFGTKLFLWLLVTVVLLVASVLVAVERAAAAGLDRLVESHLDHAERSLRVLSDRTIQDLSDAADTLSQASRIVTMFEAPEKRQGILGEALIELTYRGLELDLLALADRSGASLGRAAKRDEALEALPGDAAPGFDGPLVRSVLERKEDLRATCEWDGQLFLALAVPWFDGARFVGVVILGRNLGRLAKEIHERLDPQDDLAFRVGSRLIGARHEADAGGRTVERPAGPMTAVLYVSVKDHIEARRGMRRAILGAGAGAVLVSVFVSILVARGISRPVAVLVEGTRRVAEGAYGHRIDLRSRDEMGDLAAAFNTMAGDLQTKEKVRAVLNKVVAREVADELLKGDLGLGGRTVRATLLFADLRGFTALTQGMAPEAVVKMLNEFMTRMSREILTARGIVDKYVGDEIIGVFGAPKSYGRDALAAVEAACRMRGRLAELNETRRLRGEPPLAMGVGIHTGEVVAGCMGSEELLSYTCIGAAMNLAARLCSAAKAGQILISEDTRKELGEGAVTQPLPPIQVKGFDRAVGVHEVLEAEGRETARRQAEEKA